MEYIVKHYGPALLGAAVIIALGVVVVGMLATDGTVAKEFTSFLTSFFERMKTATGF